MVAKSLEDARQGYGQMTSRKVLPELELLSRHFGFEWLEFTRLTFSLLPLIAELSHKLSLTPEMLRIHVGRLRIGQAWYHAIELRHLKQGQRIVFQQPGHDVLIFFRCPSAGRINQGPAWLKHKQCLLQNFSLQRRTLARIFRRPVVHGLTLLAEHAFARARRIQHNQVKISRKDLGQALWRLIGCDHIAGPEALQVLGQNLAALGMYFIGY